MGCCDAKFAITRQVSVRISGWVVGERSNGMNVFTNFSEYGVRMVSLVLV